MPVHTRRSKQKDQGKSRSSINPLSVSAISSKEGSQSESDDDVDSSDDSDLESDAEDTRLNVLKRIKKINERKQELIKRLKLHEAASKLRVHHHLGLARPKVPKVTKTKQKSYKSTYRSLPRRKSLRLQNSNEATSVTPLMNDAFEPVEEIKESRPSASEYPIKTYSSDEESEEKSKQPPSNRIPTSFQSSSLKLCENTSDISQNGYKDALQNMIRNGCVARKLVEKRIYAIAIHPREDILLVAAASTGGTIGFLKMKSIKDSLDEESTCSFPTYSRTVSNLVFPRSKPNKLYFSSYAGALRSLDLTKGVFEKALYDNDRISLSTFDFFDPPNNGVVAGCGNGDLIVLDSRSSSPVSTVDAHDRIVKSVSVHPLNNHYFSTSSNDRLIKIFDLRLLAKNMKESARITNHSQTVDSAYFSPLSGRYLLTTSLDNTIRVYDSSTLTSPVMTSCVNHNNATGRWLSNFRAVWHPTRDDVIAVGSMNWPVRQIDIFNSRLDRIDTLTDENNLTSICCLLAIHPSRHVITGGNSSGKVFVFEG